MKPSVIPKFSHLTFKHLDHQQHQDKQINKRHQIEKTSQIIKNSKKNKTPNMNSQNQSQSQYQNVPHQCSQTVFYNDQPRATLDLSENYPFFQQNKNIANKHHFRNQPHYSEDEK